MIVECFPFFNEFDLLDAHLHEMAPVVDRFVICEATLTHSGRPKPLYLTAHPDAYRTFSDRVDLVVMDSYQGLDTTASWELENAQHQLGLDVALRHMAPGDVLVYTDCDEIPRAEAVRRFAASTLPGAALEMELYYYALNCRAHRPWRGASVVRWDGRPLTHRQIHRRQPNRVLDAGWHFSYLGDIKTKLDAFAHTEYACPPWNTPEHIQAKIDARADLFDRRGYQFEVVQDLSYLPRYMQDHLDRYGRYVYA